MNTHNCTILRHISKSGVRPRVGLKVPHPDAAVATLRSVTHTQQLLLSVRHPRGVQAVGFKPVGAITIHLR